jgi:hypothetical protein
LKKAEVSDKVKAVAVPQKKTYSSKDLPLTDIENGTKRFQDEVMPIILSWASTLHDPFGINGDANFGSVPSDPRGSRAEIFGPGVESFAGAVCLEPTNHVIRGITIYSINLM